MDLNRAQSSNCKTWFYLYTNVPDDGSAVDGRVCDQGTWGRRLGRGHMSRISFVGDNGLRGVDVGLLPRENM